MRYAPLLLLVASNASAADFAALAEKHCISCHDADTKKGGLDLTALNPDATAAWVKVHDRIRANEMPPTAKQRADMDAKETEAAVSALAARLKSEDEKRIAKTGRAPLRRLTRVEFENTLRDLLDVPGLRALSDLPTDGLFLGFDRSAEALPFSFVHHEKYLAAVDKALELATPAFADRPPVFKYRYAPWHNTRHGGKEADLMISVLLGQRSCFGLTGPNQNRALKSGPWENRFQLFDGDPPSTALGYTRHEDADLRYELWAVPVVPGPHTLRVRGYSFGWDTKQVTETDRHGAISFGKKSAGRFGTVDLPPNKAGTGELSVWLDRGHGAEREAIQYNPASVEKIRDFPHDKKTGLGEFGPPCPAQGVAVEWFEIEGPTFARWPPRSQTAQFGDLPVKAWAKEGGRPKPAQLPWADDASYGLVGHTDPYKKGLPPVEVVSADPEKDAARLLADFLGRAFRRPATPAGVERYQRVFAAKLKDGAHFQDALKAAYRLALASPDFLLLHGTDDYALAARLSYLLWAGPPDDELLRLAGERELGKPDVRLAQANRLLADPKGGRFVDSFTDQWLKLRDVDATVPDKELYPEFMPVLQDAMVAETRAYFAELLKENHPAAAVVKSDFAMLNEPLARHYGIPDVNGHAVRKVTLPKDSPRGGFLGQGTVLKVSANGTTTSPVVRGAFVLERILGVHPVPPPPDAGAIEPDTRGATTIREQLEKHKRNASCAGCHAKMDPYGFALESFDVVGGWREKFRVRGAPSAKTGTAGRPFVHGNGIAYHLDKPVDSTGRTPDGKEFKTFAELRDILAADDRGLARAFVRQFVTYATGAEPSFSERAEVERILDAAEASRYGLRSLVLGVVGSKMFAGR